MADTTLRYAFPYQEATDPPDGAALGQNLAEAVEAALGSLQDEVEGAWASYTPVWSANSGTVTLGNGTLTGSRRIVGKTGHVRIVLTWGSTSSSSGAGVWSLSLPFVPKADGLLAVYVDDSSASARWSGQARIINSSATGDNMRIVTGTSTISGNAIPMTWATGDKLILHGTLEIA